jgi:hypothetical protein
MKITATTAMGEKIVAVLEDYGIDIERASKPASSIFVSGGNKGKKNFRYVLELPDSPVLMGLQDLKHFRVFTNVSLTPSGSRHSRGNYLAEVVENPGHRALVLQGGNVRRIVKEIHCPGFLSVKKPITPSETGEIKPAEDKQGRRVYNGFDFCDIDGWLEVGESFEGTGHFGTHIKGEIVFRVEFVDFVFFAVKQFN